MTSKIAISGEAAFKFQTHPLGTFTGAFGQVRVIDLCLIDQLGVIAEIHVAQFGVPVQPQRFPDKGIELPRQKVGQVKGGGFIIAVAANA